MKKFFFATAIVAAMLFAFAPVFNPASAAAPAKEVTRVQAIDPINIVGTILGGGNFAGQFSVTRFVSQNGQLLASGVLTGTLTDVLGNVLGTVNQVLQIPVTGASGSCQILHLDLGPLNLDLLGLEVHLNQVVLDITAQSGSGKLLGNLLCAVANLLNGGGPLTAITGLLNRILGQL